MRPALHGRLKGILGTEGKDEHSQEGRINDGKTGIMQSRAEKTNHKISKMVAVSTHLSIITGHS